MILEDFSKAFESAYPKAVDFPDTELQGCREEVLLEAKKFGYRLAGVRNGFAVFTSKPEKDISAA